MSFKDMIKKNFYNQNLMYDYICHLIDIKDYKNLEEVFKTNLQQSYDIRVWKIYLDYCIKIKKIKHGLREVYEFALSHIGHHWDSLHIYKSYISQLNLIEDGSERVEAIRNTYIKILHIPFHNLVEIWNEFEEFETELNKMTARKVINDMLPVYQNTYKYYNTIHAYINNFTFENAFIFLDIERKNKLNFDAINYKIRMNFLFKYTITKFFSRYEFYYLFSEFLKNDFEERKFVLEQGLLNTSSMFLKIYYGNIIDDKLYFSRLLEEQYDDVVAYNMLNYVLKKEGLVSFRKMFIELKVRYKIGPVIYKYVAEAEFYTSGSKKTAYNIYNAGLESHPNSMLLKEEYFHFLLRIGDENNAKAFFKRVEKNDKMWDAMITYEYSYGGNTQFNELVEERISSMMPEGNSSGIKEDDNLKINSSSFWKLYYLKKNYSYNQLQIDFDQKLIDFMNKLPMIPLKKDVLVRVNLDNFIKIVKNISL